MLNINNFLFHTFDYGLFHAAFTRVYNNQNATTTNYQSNWWRNLFNVQVKRSIVQHSFCEMYSVYRVLYVWYRYMYLCAHIHVIEL